MNALYDPASSHTLMLDYLGYDGWPAAYCLAQISKGNKAAAASICHSAHETSFVAEMLANKIFSAAREGTLKIAGFPDFLAVVQDLKKSSGSQTAPQYSVCTPLADGTLVVKSAIIELWTTKNESFKDETAV